MFVKLNLQFYIFIAEMELVAVHALQPGEAREAALRQAVQILNYEWPRSETIRRRGLETSSAGLPSHLLLLQGDRVLGHARISKIPADNSKIFIESVVVHPQLR